MAAIFCDAAIVVTYDVSIFVVLRVHLLFRNIGNTDMLHHLPTYFLVEPVVGIIYHVSSCLYGSLSPPADYLLAKAVVSIPRPNS